MIPEPVLMGGDLVFAMLVEVGALPTLALRCRPPPLENGCDARAEKGQKDGRVLPAHEDCQLHATSQAAA
jgi:hypothetical protein